MLKADARTKDILDRLRPPVATITKPYAGRASTMPIQQLVANPLRNAVNATLGLQLDEAEFRRWVKFESAPRGVDIKINHVMLAEARSAAPEWVFALLWCFYPNYAPHFE